MRHLSAAAAALLLAACGSDGKRTGLLGPTGLGPGATCTATAQCRSDLVCRAGTCGALAAAPSCPSAPGTPAILKGDTFDPGDPGPTACVSTARGPAFGGAGDVVVQDLGEHLVGETVSFAVTPGTSSFTIVSQEVNGSAVDTISYQGHSLPNVVVPDQVKTGAGVLYYDDIAVDRPDAVYLGFTPVSGAFTAPNTSAGLDTVRNAGLAPGTWTFRANDWAYECPSVAGCSGGSTSGRYRLHAVTKSAPVASTGALDVEVYLLTDPAGAISTAAGAVAHPQIQRWVSSLSAYLGRAGLCVGDVTFHDLPAWVHERYPNATVDVTTDGPCEPLNQLFTAAVVPKRAVHLFLVEELVAPAQGGASIVGVDGSIPGPSGFPGTIYGGAAIGLFGQLGAGSCGGAPSLACGTDVLAYVAAHEVGHWLGLSHTTEGTLDFFDPLGDTAECPCTCAPTTGLRTQCTSGAAFKEASWCTASAGCGGGDNLMFWLLQPGLSTGALSRDQGQVVRLNPAVR